MEWSLIVGSSVKGWLVIQTDFYVSIGLPSFSSIRPSDFLFMISTGFLKLTTLLFCFILFSL
jgi:hypothetical protein